MSDLWRFPVKSFGGERLRRAFVGPFGMLGDRRHAVVDAVGEGVSARRVSALLGYRAHYADGDAAEDVRIDGPAVACVDADDPRLTTRLAEVVGGPARIVRTGASAHDVAPLHLISSASLAGLGALLGDAELDRRRFRANLVIEPEGGDPFAEAGWVGRTVRVGGEGPVLTIAAPTERCAVTTFDPETLERRPEVHGTIARERENFFGVYALVARAGWVAVGDPLLPAD